MTASRLLPIKQNTDIVTYTILINGESISRAYNILSVLVNKEVNRIPYARITLSDGDPAAGDFAISNEATFIPGNDIEILGGYHFKEETIFKGIITKHSIKIRNNYSQLIVDCKDQAVKMTIGEKSKFFSEKTDKDIIEEILKDYVDLESEIEDTTFQHKELVQYNVTDWDFIISRTDAAGQICIVDNGKLTTLKPSISDDPVASPLFGATILEFDAEMDVRNQVKSIKMSAWDFVDQEIVEATAAEPDWEENGDVNSARLADAIGPEIQQFNHSGPLATDELQSWADARLLRNRMSKIRGRVKFQGMASVKPGITLELAGVGNRINGKVYVTGVRHELSNGNWVCDAQFGMTPEWHTKQFEVSCPPASGLIPSIKGLHIGLVSHLQDDPLGENRIQVKIPTISTEEEGIWARIATLDAGKERGTFFLPELSDEVIVGFINDDPRHAVILGMLHSSGKPAPLTASDDNNQKGIFSREKLKILFDDEKKSISIETPGGRKIIMDDENGNISLEDKRGNKIILDDNGITIDSAGELSIKAAKDIKAEGKMNVNLKASMNLKAEGTAGAEISSSATAVLKGSIVQIN